MLRVLDTPAQVGFVGPRYERALEQVQRFAVAAVADRMHAQLEVVLDGDARQIFE